MRFALRAVLAALLCGALAGCATTPQFDSSHMTPLQIRALQTRDYDGNTTSATLKTVLNVLQDEGFLIDYGNTELGLLHGTKTLDDITAQTFGLRPTHFIVPMDAFGPVVNEITIDVTANISEFGAQTRVRINFQQKVKMRDRLVSASPVIDAQVYQQFFAKLERGLFIAKQGI